MSFFSSIWKVVRKAAPAIAGSLLLGPAGLGLATAATGGAIGGGLSGLLSGGGLKGTALGALGGYGVGSGVGAIGSAAAAYGGAPAVGTFGPQAGGMSSALSSLGGSTGLSSLPSTIANIGSSAGKFLSNPIDGISGLASKAGNSLSSILSGGGTPAAAPGIGSGTTVAGAGAGGGASSFGGGSLLNVLSGINNLSTQDKAKDQLLEEQRKNLLLNKPYLETGNLANQSLQDRMAEFTSTFNPSDLKNDPGYKFQLEQGTEAMNRANSAGGNLDSGEALKAAQQFGTGLADSTYNAAFTRWLQNNKQNYDVLAGQQGVGMNAAGNAQGINTDIGNVKANATTAKSNTMTGTLASILSGSGAKRVIGYKSDGTAIYA